MSRTLVCLSLNLLCLSGFLFNPVNAAEPTFAHLETRGYSKIVTAADMAKIEVAVVSNAKTAQQAKALSDKAVASFINKLTQAKVNQADIHSANLTLQPQYEVKKNQPRTIVGYKANRQVTVTVRQLSQLNLLLDNAISKGINRINYIEFQSSNAVKIKQQARQLAIKDAQQKAKSLAHGFGTQLQGVWKIRYLDHQIQPVRHQMRTMALEDSISHSYQPNDVTITDNVEVTFRLQ